MERIVEAIDFGAGWLVPVLTLWAIGCLYSLRSGCRCRATEWAYYAALLLVSGVTLRTVMADDNCWLVHTASLCTLIIAGVMRRPAEHRFTLAEESLV